MAIIAPDIGIDFGTSNTLLYAGKKGIIINEPTLIAVSGTERMTLQAVGSDAMKPGDAAVRVIRPIREGRVKDYEMAVAMLRYFIRKAIGASYLIRPRICITVPYRLSAVERRVVRETAQQAGARKNGVFLIDKPFAAAHGAGLSVFKPEGALVVDVGGGTTDVALISLGGIVVAKSVRVGGMTMDEALMEMIRRDYNMMISDRMAENIKIDWGSALPLKEEKNLYVRGRDLITNLPKTLEISSSKIHEALKPLCAEILSAVRTVLSKAPAELAGDVVRRGIHLVGGAAQLYALDIYLENELGIKVSVARDPMTCAALGVGGLAENIDLLPRIGRTSFLNEEDE